MAPREPPIAARSLVIPRWCSSARWTVTRSRAVSSGNAVPYARPVAGSLGPTQKSITLTGQVTMEQLRDSYYRHAKPLLEGGADILLVETAFDTRNIKAAVLAIHDLERELGIRIPLMISGSSSSL